MYLKSADIPDGVVVEAPVALTPERADAQLLRAAVQNLRRGWCKGYFALAEGGEIYFAHEINRVGRRAIARVCARGALFLEEVREESRDELRLASHLIDQLVSEDGKDASWARKKRATFGRGRGDLHVLPSWNNHACRTLEEVVGLFERTASRLESA